MTLNGFKLTKFGVFYTSIYLASRLQVRKTKASSTSELLKRPDSRPAKKDCKSI